MLLNVGLNAFGYLYRLKRSVPRRYQVATNRYSECAQKSIKPLSTSLYKCPVVPSSLPNHHPNSDSHSPIPMLYLQ
jgi:hypothetical protein